MPGDFDSHTISLILSWVFFVPLVLGVIGAALTLSFNDEFPLAFGIWLVLCAALFSPVRYILLQLSVGFSYPLQSISAFLSSFLLALYIPIVFAILCAIGLFMPYIGILAIAGRRTKGLLWVAALAAPFVMVVCSYLYFLMLPYAAYSTHWLKATDVIRATNGPSEYLYKYVVEEGTPLQFPGFIRQGSFASFTPTERLRAHVAAIYLR